MRVPVYLSDCTGCHEVSQALLGWAQTHNHQLVPLSSYTSHLLREPCPAPPRWEQDQLLLMGVLTLDQQATYLRLLDTAAPYLITCWPRMRWDLMQLALPVALPLINVREPEALSRFIQSGAEPDVSLTCLPHDLGFGGLGSQRHAVHCLGLYIPKLAELRKPDCGMAWRQLRADWTVAGGAGLLPQSMSDAIWLASVFPWQQLTIDLDHQLLDADLKPAESPMELVAHLEALCKVGERADIEEVVIYSRDSLRAARVVHRLRQAGYTCNDYLTG